MAAAADTDNAQPMATPLFKWLFADTADDRFHECRNCGTGVPADTDTCPACGAQAIATYDV